MCMSDRFCTDSCQQPGAPFSLAVSAFFLLHCGCGAGAAADVGAASETSFDGSISYTTHWATCVASFDDAAIGGWIALGAPCCCGGQCVVDGALVGTAFSRAIGLVAWAVWGCTGGGDESAESE